MKIKELADFALSLIGAPVYRKENFTSQFKYFIYHDGEIIVVGECTAQGILFLSIDNYLAKTKNRLILDEFPIEGPALEELKEKIKLLRI